MTRTNETCDARRSRVTGRHARRVRYACAARVLAQLRLACHISQARESTCSLFLTLTQHLTHTHHLPRTIPHTKSLFPYPMFVHRGLTTHECRQSSVSYKHIYTCVYIYVHVFTYICVRTPRHQHGRRLFGCPSLTRDETPNAYVSLIHK